MGTEIVELSHPLHDGMTTYPGLPKPAIGLHLDHTASRAHYDDQAEFAIGCLQLVGNTSTHLDSPYHRFPHGDDIAALPLQRLVDLPTTVIDVRPSAQQHRRLEPVTATAAQPLAGRAVLVRTGWDRRWGSAPYWHNGPYLGPTFVERLVHARPALVGVDFCNVDDPADPSRPVHTALLGTGIPIVEHLRDLHLLPADARTFVIPLAVHGAPSLPVRAFAISRPPEPAQSHTPDDRVVPSGHNHDTNDPQEEPT